MNPVKQALNLFLREPKISLLLGISAYLFVLVVSRIPYVGAWFMIFGFLVIEIFVWHWQSQHSLHFPTTLYKKLLGPLLVTSFILIPTGMLLGSSAGVLQRTDQLLASIPLAYFITFISLYFFMVLTHALYGSVATGRSFVKTMDEQFGRSLRKPYSTLAALLILSAVFLLGIFPWALGLIIALPLLFYSTYFTFTEADIVVAK